MAKRNKKWILGIFYLIVASLALLLALLTLPQLNENFSILVKFILSAAVTGTFIAFVILIAEGVYKILKW